MARLMKDSGIEWIGEIPQEWSLFRIKHIIEQSKDGIKIGPFGSALTNKTIDDGEFNVYSQANLVSGDYSTAKHTVTDEVFNALSNYEVYPGDICLSMMGTIGKCKSVPTNITRGIMDSHLIKIRLGSNVLSRFFEYAYDKDLGGVCFAQMQYDKKGFIMDGLNTSVVKNLFFVLPTVYEQQRIVSFLDQKCDEIDSVIAKTEATIEEYKALKQSIITEAVTKGIRGNRLMKDSGIEWIGEIPEEWNVKVAFQVFQQVKNKNEGLVEKNLLSLSYGKIKRKSIDTIGGLLPENFDGYNIIEKDDIVLRLTDLQNDHTSLRAGLSPERGIVTSAYLTLRNQSDNMSEFLYYYLHSYDINKGFYGMGAGVRQGLNWDGLKLLKIALPSVAEQKEITEYCNSKTQKIDELIGQKSGLLKELGQYKKSLIYEYVTGKREVN